MILIVFSLLLLLRLSSSGSPDNSSSSAFEVFNPTLVAAAGGSRRLLLRDNNENKIRYMDASSRERQDRYERWMMNRKNRQNEKKKKEAEGDGHEDKRRMREDESRSRQMMLRRERQRNPGFEKLELQRQARSQTRLEHIKRWQDLRESRNYAVEHENMQARRRREEMRKRKTTRKKTTKELVAEWERRYSMAERGWARESRMLHTKYGDMYRDNLGVNSNTDSEKPVMFVHISNSGGTAACNSVSGGGVRTTFEGNCNLMCNMPWHWSRYYKGPGEWTEEEMKTLDSCDQKDEHVQNMMVDERDCEAMAEYAKKWKFRVLFREMLLAETGEKANDFTICPQFRYVMFFKDPVKRYKSELSIRHGFDGVNATKRFVEKSYAGVNKGERAWFGPSLLNLRENLGHIMPGTPGINNFVTRTLLGPDVYTLPPKKITEEHLNRARAILSKFEAVIPLEKAFESYTWRIFASLFPEVGERLFYKTKAQLWCKYANVKNVKHKDNIAGDEKLHKMIEEMNTIDTKLHSEITAKYEKQMEMFYEQHPYENKRRLKTLPTCAEARTHYHKPSSSRPEALHRTSTTHARPASLKTTKTTEAVSDDSVEKSGGKISISGLLG